MMVIKRLISIVLAAAVSACATSTPVQYLSLDDGQPATLSAAKGPGVVITQLNVPELIDRSQLVVRSGEHQLRIDQQYQWAEPLRYQVARVVARYLGTALDSGRVVALTTEGQNFVWDFKLLLDVQRFDIIPGQRVELDVVWRTQTAGGSVSFGRAVVSEAITEKAGNDYINAVAASNRALRSLANTLASELKLQPSDAVAD